MKAFLQGTLVVTLSGFALAIVGCGGGVVEMCRPNRFHPQSCPHFRFLGHTPWRAAMLRRTSAE